MTWRFHIDVGGTFTDVLAESPEGQVLEHKTLSSGRIKGHLQREHHGRCRVVELAAEPDGLFDGWQFEQQGHRRTIERFHHGGWLDMTGMPPEPGRCEIHSGESAPLVAIRRLLGLPLTQRIPPVEMRLGTTMGTNALLERKGVAVGLVTTEGFEDVLRIGHQDRPHLFDWRIEKPECLFRETAGVPERVAADGRVLKPLDTMAARRVLEAMYHRGLRSLAICLLNSYACPGHELQVEKMARDIGFSHISTSVRIAPSIKLVTRGQTTVVDAYLTPLLESYVRELQTALPGSMLRMMTSAGGLIAASHFVGKDSILSGPAGGVVGFSSVARDAGYEKAIGFDMGGTSTDVSRYDGAFDYEFETIKAGTHLATPMLAIETVAAGGGSCCIFDGQKLVVGPESAGAEPGPACYGRGGPLAVTDVNVYLGRIPAEHFPFPLDVATVQERLADLADTIARSTGKQLSCAEIAEGFLAIADENMAAAIKRISIAKGYDVRDYVLVCFGGAGAQHACGVADRIGIDTILLHPRAGVLSAYGMGCAPVQRFAEKTVLAPCSQDIFNELAEWFEAETSRLRAELAGEGIPTDGCNQPLRLLDMRYQGQSATLTVRAETYCSASYTRSFQNLYRQRFGHVLDRPLDIVTARLECSGELPRMSATASGCAVPGPGESLEGPLSVPGATCTLYIALGWRAERSEAGHILLRRHTPRNEREIVAREADPVQLEIFNNHFAHIAEQMGEVLRRTALSTNIKERLDFSCAIFGPDGALVANAPHIPVHLGAMSQTIQSLLETAMPLRQGDVIVTNDPFAGGSHLPDITVITPVVDESGRLLFFAASRGHHAEIGGKTPGSMPPDSRRLDEEGVLLRHVKVVDQGLYRESILKALLTGGPYPSRSPDENLADLSAQMAANQAGVEQLGRMTARYSLPVVQAYMQHIRRAAARKMRHALGRFADGTYAFEDRLDNGARIRVSIQLSQGRAVFDFSGTDDVTPDNLNANPAIVRSAVIYVLRCLIQEAIPMNEGVLDPVGLVLPPCLLNPPDHGVAVVGGNVETSQRLVDVLLGALGVAAASQGTMNNILFGCDTFGYYETLGGGAGAGPDWHGADAVHTHMTNTRLTDPEVLETRYPVRLVRFAIRPGSGGAGKHHGGCGLVREIEFLEPLDVSLLTGRRQSQPFGLCGGEPGLAGENAYARGEPSDAVCAAFPEQRWQPLGWRARMAVCPGDRLRIMTPGGGGYGCATGGGRLTVGG